MTYIAAPQTIRARYLYELGSLQSVGFSKLRTLDVDAFAIPVRTVLIEVTSGNASGGGQLNRGESLKITGSNTGSHTVQFTLDANGQISASDAGGWNGNSYKEKVQVTLNIVGYQ